MSLPLHVLASSLEHRFAGGQDHSHGGRFLAGLGDDHRQVFHRMPQGAVSQTVEEWIQENLTRRLGHLTRQDYFFPGS